MYFKNKCTVNEHRHACSVALRDPLQSKSLKAMITFTLCTDQHVHAYNVNGP